MSSTMRAVGDDEPVMVAWKAYKATEEYANALKWATDARHVEGSLWAAFSEGFAASPPVARPAVTRDQLLTMYAVQLWQRGEMMHPLTCGNDSSHGSLVAVPVNDGVELWCADCSYRQSHIPPTVRAALGGSQ